MAADEDVADCYTHSRKFTYEGYAFYLQINDDLMSYTATVSRDEEVVTTVTDLRPETAGLAPDALAIEILG